MGLCVVGMGREFSISHIVIIRPTLSAPYRFCLFYARLADLFISDISLARAERRGIQKALLYSSFYGRLGSSCFLDLYVGQSQSFIHVYLNGIFVKNGVELVQQHKKKLDGYSTTRGRNICLRRVHDQ